ncbi:MAG TPA: YdcH family protein, partial [Dongiaceae bacterium]|nr:YdcH family protein [Dongiaceae bacterium]
FQPARRRTVCPATTSRKGDSPMALTSHMESLKAKHSDLEARIADEERRPHPDEVCISDLKKQKLRIKDELTQLVRVN